MDRFKASENLIIFVWIPMILIVTYTLDDYLPLGIAISVILFVAYIITNYVRNKYNITFMENYRPAVHFQKWIALSLFLIFILAALYVGVILRSMEGLLYILIINHITYHAFRAIMEYVYDRKEKQYIPNFIWACSYSIMIIVIPLFMPPIITFADYVNELEVFNEDEISQIDIRQTGEEKNKAIIRDKQLIEQLIDELSHLEIQRKLMNSEDSMITYRLDIKSGDNSNGNEFIFMTVTEHFVSLNGKEYKVMRNNGFYEMLEEFDFD